jgi:HemY protein
MLRALFYWLILAVLVGVAWYLADQQPGQVSIEWLDYRIDTSVGILLLAVGLLAGVAAVIYRVWRGLPAKRARRGAGPGRPTSCWMNRH